MACQFFSSHESLKVANCVFALSIERFFAEQRCYRCTCFWSCCLLLKPAFWSVHVWECIGDLKKWFSVFADRVNLDAADIAS